MLTYRNIPENPEVLFAALGHPVRLKTIECLSKSGPISAKVLLEQVNQIQINGRTTPLSMQLFLKHLKILKESDLIRRSKQGRFHYCEINSHAIEQMIEWLALQNYF